MKWDDLKNKNTDEIKELLAEQRSILHNLNFQASSKQLKQVHKVNEAKKTISRLRSLLAARIFEKAKDEK
ncbi:MAG: 50S ribosomal protein L29 [bacterium]